MNIKCFRKRKIPKVKVFYINKTLDEFKLSIRKDKEIDFIIEKPIRYSQIDISRVTLFYYDNALYCYMFESMIVGIAGKIKEHPLLFFDKNGDELIYPINVVFKD